MLAAGGCVKEHGLNWSVGLKANGYSVKGRMSLNIKEIKIQTSVKALSTI